MKNMVSLNAWMRSVPSAGVSVATPACFYIGDENPDETAQNDASLSQAVADALKLENTQDYFLVSNKIWPKQSSVGTVSDVHGLNHVYALDLWLAHDDVLSVETATLK